jgi:hypothetical protein
VKSTEGITLNLTKHAKRQAKSKGFPVKNILDMWSGKPRIVASRTYPGQYRVCGDGICLVGVPKGQSFVAITVYVDQELTPPREDQMSTRAGRRYAKRFAKGKGRG